MSEKNDLAQKVVERNLVVSPPENQQEFYNQVSIIKGLSVENDLIKIELRLRGYTFDFFKNGWLQTRRPILNANGRGNFMSALQAIGDIANFSNYDEKEIPKLALMFFEENYPNYLVYHKEFGLDPKDYNVIRTILQFWALSVLKNAKSAGHRNVVRGTLSEGILARALGNGEQPKEKKRLFGFLRRGDKRNG
jgi:hypothetical protein